MASTSTVMLTSDNYFQWRSHMEDLLRSKGMYQITMRKETDANPHSQQWVAPPGPSHSTARRVGALPLPLGNSITHSLLWNLPFRNSGSRVSRTREPDVHSPRNKRPRTPNYGVNGQCFGFRSYPYRDITTGELNA
jgi:hypothetical protein